MIKTIEINNKNFFVDIDIPQNWNNKMILMCHGFDSDKNSTTLKILSDEFLKCGIATAKFNLPYHGDRRQNNNDLTVENCINDINLIENEIREEFKEIKLGLLGSSFGAYLELLKLSQKENNYFIIALKSPAIKMDKILKEELIKEDFETFKERGYSIRNVNSEMKINYSFYEELEKNDLFKKDVYNKNIIIFHGDKDDTAPVEDTIKFVEKNPKIKLKVIKDANHKMNEKELKSIAEECINFIKKVEYVRE